MTILVKVKVIANAKKEIVENLGDDSYTLSVKEKAERNEANVRARELIAREYKVLPHKVHILTGHHSPSKICTVDIE
jgi:uncharacterized protein YggU (UPF0235/DUF167 family)